MRRANIQDRSIVTDLPGPNWSRMNVTLGRHEGGQHHAQKNGTHPKRSFNICGRSSLKLAKDWRCSTPVGSSALLSKNAGAVSQWRAVLHTQGSADLDGTLEKSRQHKTSSQQSQGPATGSRNDPTCELSTNMVGGTTIPGWSVSDCCTLDTMFVRYDRVHLCPSRAAAHEEHQGHDLPNVHEPTPPHVLTVA